MGTEWTKALPTDEGRESDEIFEFDGANTAVAVPKEVLNHNLSSVFTVSAWLKHKHIPNQEKHVKEHVVCSADDHSKLLVFSYCFNSVLTIFFKIFNFSFDLHTIYII